MTPEEFAWLRAVRFDQAEEALRDAELAPGCGASPRNIVNRAYYACFYAASALTMGVPNPPRKHAQVLNLVDSEYVRRGLLDKRFSAILHSLFSLRNESDYRMMQSPDSEDAVAALKSAPEFIHAARRVVVPRD